MAPTPSALPAAVNVLARSDAAYTERDNLRTFRTVIETSAQRAESAIRRAFDGECCADWGSSV
jgi:hypothetical protein